MMSSMQLGSNCLTRTPLPAPSRQRISRHSRFVATRIATRSPAPTQAPSSEQTRQQLEEAFEAPPAAPAQVLPSPAEGSAQASASASAAPPGAAPSEAKVSAARRNIILIDGDTLESSNEHRAWVAGGMLLFGSLFAVGASQIHDLPSAIGATAAAGTAYLTAGTVSVHRSICPYRILQLCRCRTIEALWHEFAQGFCVPSSGMNLACCGADHKISDES